MLAAAEQIGTRIKIYLRSISVLQTRNLAMQGFNLSQDGPLYAMSAKPDQKANRASSMTAASPKATLAAETAEVKVMMLFFAMFTTKML